VRLVAKSNVFWEQNGSSALDLCIYYGWIISELPRGFLSRRAERNYVNLFH
jgi:hypothetical protein